MKKSAVKSKRLLTASELRQLRAEEEKAGVSEEFRFPKRYKVIPKDQRHQFPPEAFEDRNTKVKISMYVDLDVLNYFKARAGAMPYQTQINAQLRRIMESEQAGQGGDAAASLRQAKGLIEAALRKIG